MYPRAPDNCPIGELSASESYHSAIAYQRPRGNLEPDADPPAEQIALRKADQGTAGADHQLGRFAAVSRDNGKETREKGQGTRERKRGDCQHTPIENRAALLRMAVAVIAVALVLIRNPITGTAQNPTVAITVDPTGNRHPIDPNIYGVAHATTAQLNDLNTPLNRNGGNNTTRYNWQLNADNRGNDWYFESIADSSATAGERGDTFIANARAANAKAMMTIPLIDWVAKVGSNRSKLARFSIAKYGAQTGNDWQWFPDAGNGVRTNGQFVTGNDPNDANVPSNSAFQQGWVQHLVSRWGTNASGGLRYYILDNEPSLWHSTHRDVRPTGATMDEIKNRMIDFATKIKAVDPTALVVGPEEWGWSGYFYSGYDQQYGSLHGWSFLPDRNNHGGADYLPWLLGQVRQSSTTAGQRLLDVFTVHYYPQGGEFSDDVSNGDAAAPQSIDAFAVGSDLRR